MLFSTVIRTKVPPTQANTKPREYAPTISLWAQQILSKKAAHKTNLQLIEETIKIEGSLVRFSLVNENGLKHSGSFELFNEGILNVSINNPNNKSGFNYHDIEAKPKLTPFYPHIAKHDKSRYTFQFADTADYEKSPVKSKYSVVIDLKPFRLTMTDQTGKEIFQLNREEKFSFGEHLLFDIRLPTHHLWGLAERADHPYLEDTNAKGVPKEPYRLWARDNPKYKPFSPLGLYGSMPVVLSLQNEETRSTVGVFQANASETYVEVEKSTKGYSDLTWLNQAGDLQMYVMAADNFHEYFYRLSQVTGFAYLPPFWALGFHQCRYSYMSEKEVDEVNTKLREFKIPCDSITLDIDHTEDFKYFTWSKERYPDPAALIKRVRANKRRIITINDPHLKEDETYAPFAKAKERGLLVRTPEGETMINYCWPGKSGWLDFINEEAQDFWASLYSYDHYTHATRDVHAWNDMNEPAVFDPVWEQSMNPRNKHKFHKNGEERDVDHLYVHNVYGHLQTKGTFKGLIQRDHPKKYRPFILTRSFFAGTQKYATVWSADCGSKFVDLSAQIPLALNTSLCGISFNGSDIGGFMGDPAPEVALRWYQYGLFMPYFRAHSNSDTKRREPYVYEPLYRDQIIKAIQERYRWLYYWYTTFEEYVRTGYPITRTVWLETKHKKITESLLKEDLQFFIGSSLLVIPIVEKYRRYVEIHPDLRDEEWFTYNGGYLENNNEPFKTGLESIGYFIRAGSILTLADLSGEILSSEDVLTKPLHLFITLGKEETAKGTFYFDDTETWDYQNKHYVRREFEFKDMKLTNKKTDEEQIPDNVQDNYISTITICGTTEEITKWTIANSHEYNLNDHKVDLKDQTAKIIHIKGLNLKIKSDWEIQFTRPEKKEEPKEEHKKETAEETKNEAQEETKNETENQP